MTAIKPLTTMIKTIGALTIFLSCCLSLVAQSERKVISFKQVAVSAEAFETAEVFDVDNDSIPDIVSGSYWYKGPDFRLMYLMSHQRRWYGDYYDDFSTIPFDVNEDGKMDFITGGWWGATLRWMENPGKDSIWAEHTIAKTGNIETTRAWDIDGDGVPEIISNNPGHPLLIYKKEKGKPSFTGYKVADKQGHGLGFGDINGDGRGDLIISDGWLEAPADRFNGSWKLHKELNLGATSVPIIVADVNKDGLNDLIVGQGHDYGLHWYEQKMEKKQRKWIKHEIDPFNSQFHALMWVDIDNDGKDELITGKRYRAHNERDPGSYDPIGLFYYKWNGESFTKEVIAYGPLGQGKGTGIYFAVHDLDGNGWKDIVVPGKDGLSIFFNQGNQ
jgi:hypothetical protein